LNELVESHQELRRKNRSITRFRDYNTTFQQRKMLKRKKNQFNEKIGSNYGTSKVNQNEYNDNIKFILKIIGYTGFFLLICFSVGIILAIIMNRQSYFVIGFFLGLSLISIIQLTLANIKNRKSKKR
jgi:hypothetical protein